MDHGDYDWATVLNTVTEQLHDNSVPSSKGKQSPEAIQYSTPEAQLERYPHLRGHSAVQTYSFIPSGYTGKCLGLNKGQQTFSTMDQIISDR